MNMSGVSQSDFRGRFESTEPCRLGSVEISFLHGQEQMRFGLFFFLNHNHLLLNQPETLLDQKNISAPSQRVDS